MGAEGHSKKTVPTRRKVLHVKENEKEKREQGSSKNKKYSGGDQFEIKKGVWKNKRGNWIETKQCSETYNNKNLSLRVQGWGEKRQEPNDNGFTPELEP